MQLTQVYTQELGDETERHQKLFSFSSQLYNTHLSYCIFYSINFHRLGSTRGRARFRALYAGRRRKSCSLLSIVSTSRAGVPCQTSASVSVRSLFSLRDRFLSSKIDSAFSLDPKMRFKDLVQRGKRPWPPGLKGGDRTTIDSQSQRDDATSLAGTYTGNTDGASQELGEAGLPALLSDEQIHKSSESMDQDGQPSGWGSLWAEAYGTVKDDPEYSHLLETFEKYLCTAEHGMYLVKNML